MKDYYESEDVIIDELELDMYELMINIVVHDCRGDRSCKIQATREMREQAKKLPRGFKYIDCSHGVIYISWRNRYACPFIKMYREILGLCNKDVTRLGKDILKELNSPSVPYVDIELSEGCNLDVVKAQMDKYFKSKEVIVSTGISEGRIFFARGWQ